jgi:hypothetical protein
MTSFWPFGNSIPRVSRNSIGLIGTNPKRLVGSGEENDLVKGLVSAKFAQTETRSTPEDFSVVGFQYMKTRMGDHA